MRDRTDIDSMGYGKGKRVGGRNPVPGKPMGPSTFATFVTRPSRRLTFSVGGVPFLKN